MLLIEVNRDIGDNRFWCNNQSAPFSAESLKKILEENPNEKEIKLNINCNGGSTREGFIIYDILRTSGRTIYANIEGGCHSMAIVLLLSAPLQNRTANPNATAVIHDVYAVIGGSTEELKAQTKEIETERERILNIYEDRTGKNKDQLRSIMLEEKERNVQDLVEWGFISKINNYNTNKFNKQMGKDKKDNLLDRIANFFGGAKNYAFQDSEGNTLFSTEGEEATLSIGMIAEPDGTFETSDGMVVEIKDGVIVAIAQPDSEVAEEVATATENRRENTELKSKLEEANVLLKEAKNRLEERREIGSNHQVKGRTINRGASKASLTSDEIKQQIQGKRK